MKKTLTILASTALLCFLLVVRLIFNHKSEMTEEREWFARALRYEFSAKVDSIYMLNQNTGKLWCRVTTGDPQVDREDSLKRYFKGHDMLYLIFKKSSDTIVFLIPYGKLVAVGDSLRVSSEKNTILFFRNGEQVASDQLSKTLTGFGRPFFLKRKNK